MKKSTFPALAAVAALVLFSLSCQKQSTISNKEKELNLEAPSGERIASSIRQLKAEAARLVLMKHASEEAFEITNINFLPVKKGYAAIVSYQLKNGPAGSYAVFSGVRYHLLQPGAVLTMRGGAANAAMAPDDGNATITCEGTCNCKMSTAINADTGVITVDCGCSNCSAQMKES